VAKTPTHMHTTEHVDAQGRCVKVWRWWNNAGYRHRTDGPAMLQWVVLPSGQTALQIVGWAQEGRAHRDGKPAERGWQVLPDGTRALVQEHWKRHGVYHRIGGPSYRRWTVGPDGTRTLELETWRVNGKLHRADGPAYLGRSFLWQGNVVQCEDLPWLRRGHGLLLAFTGATQQGGGRGVSPAWSRDTRVAVTGTDSASTTVAPTLAAYRSAVGGSVLLCV